MDKMLTTHEVAKMAQIHRDTLLRWLREGRIPEPTRDRNGWRVFTPEEAQTVLRYAQGGQQLMDRNEVKESAASYSVSSITKLQRLDWNFVDANTGYLTHSLHPYPAKFIPQIPNTLIQELSSVGDTVLDPFCGSGTTLVEALLLRRHAIGIDANPLSQLIASAKTVRLSPDQVEQLRTVETQASDIASQLSGNDLPLFPSLKAVSLPDFERPNFDGLDFWFVPHVIDELSMLKKICLSVESESARQVAKAIFSSIIVAVSRQDSDTRYVRREKNIKPGETAHRFARAMGIGITKAIEFTELTEARFKCRVVLANVLDEPEIEPVDLVVCSPPYPNAYSYHLYHRTRLLWLDMDQIGFKKVEIGSHRKYSSKGEHAATVDTFRAELSQILHWISTNLRIGGYACFVIGDSLLKGQLIHNDDLLVEVAAQNGYQLETSLVRCLQDSKKSFNPVIGKIKQEHIVILRNTGG